MFRGTGTGRGRGRVRVGVRVRVRVSSGPTGLSMSFLYTTCGKRTSRMTPVSG